MNEQEKKAEAFVGRLLSNPALADLNPLQKEEQIIQFLQVNSPQLYPTLSSAGFFPGETWPQITGRLVEALFSVSDRSILPEMEKLIMGGLDLSFIAFLRQNARADQAGKNTLLTFESGMLKSPEARRELAGVLASIEFGIIDKYLDEAYERKEYVHFELTKVQRLRMSKEEVKNLIKVSALLKPSVYFFSSSSGGQTNQAGLVQASFAEKAVSNAREALPFLPEEVLKSAVYSNVSFLDNRYIDATSRIAGILSALSRQYRRNLRIDRGADTQEKSWLSIARKNFRFFGYDVKLIDEFYKIAAENGW